MRDCVHGVGHSPVYQIFLQMVSKALIISSSPPAFTSSPGILSIPADFPFFSDLIAASTSTRRMGWSSLLVTEGTFGTSGSPVVL